jgi:hypothetical protein
MFYHFFKCVRQYSELDQFASIVSHSWSTLGFLRDFVVASASQLLSLGRTNLPAKLQYLLGILADELMWEHILYSDKYQVQVIRVLRNSQMTMSVRPLLTSYVLVRKSSPRKSSKVHARQTSYLGFSSHCADIGKRP